MTVHINLNQEEVYKKFDPSNMAKRISSIAEYSYQAWNNPSLKILDNLNPEIDNILMVGMGGSGLSCHLIKDLTSKNKTDMPIQTWNQSILPQYINKKTLIIATSYSGNTEETINLVNQSFAKNAQVIAISKGGELSQLAKNKKFPWIPIEFEGEARSAFPFNFLSALKILEKLKIFKNMNEDITQTIESLNSLAQKLIPSIPDDSNQAKKIAYELFEKIPIIYSSGILTNVGTRWRTQINENAKAWAFSDQLTELHHNSIEGYLNPLTIGTKQTSFKIILIENSIETESMKNKYKITRELLSNKKIPYITVNSYGDSSITQIMSSILIGDFASYYLGILYKTNPAICAEIDIIKTL